MSQCGYTCYVWDPDQIVLDTLRSIINRSFHAGRMHGEDLGRVGLNKLAFRRRNRNGITVLS